MSTSDPTQVYDSMIQSGACPPTDADVKDYCKHLRTPAWLLGSAVSMLKQYFGMPERICLDKATFVWNPKVEDSQVYIDDDFNWNFQNVGQRPAIIVELQGFDNIEEIPTLGRSGLISHNPGTDTFNFASIEKGSLMFRCIAKQKLECWALAWEVKMFLQSYADGIKETYGFKTFRVSGVDAPQKMEEYDEYKVATVKLPFSMIDAWAIRRENLKVQTIDPTFALNTEGTTFFKDDKPD